MKKLALKFHAGLPTDCPLEGATTTTKRIYRALRSGAPDPYDFQSEAERKAYPHGTGSCAAWGLSSWVSLEAVQTARNIVPGFRKKCIASFVPTHEDGVLLKTATSTQPEHYTFWLGASVDLSARCTIEIPRGSA